MEHYFSYIECESGSDGPTTSKFSVSVECGECEYESLPTTSVLSCEDLIATSVDASGTLCPVPAEQLNSDCQVLILLQPDSPAEQKLLNFAKFKAPPTYKFPKKLECRKNHAFQYHYLQTYLWLDIHLHKMNAFVFNIVYSI